MGRPLKIKKISEASYNSTTGANPGTDIGFNALVSLTNPVTPSNVWNGTEYLGVVGGSNTVDTAAYPTVQCRVFITGFAEEDGYIIRQKGSHKYLVGGTTARTALVAGRAYRVTVVGDTNWAAYGAGSDVAVGDVFTATAALANTGTGRVNAVGQCVLINSLTGFGAGNMSISYFDNSSTETAISKLTNKFLQNFAGGATGGNATGSETWAYTDTVDNVAYAANFFSDEGTTAKSGAEVDTWGKNGSEQLTTGALDLAIVQNYNS